MAAEWNKLDVGTCLFLKSVQNNIEHIVFCWWTDHFCNLFILDSVYCFSGLENLALFLAFDNVDSQTGDTTIRCLLTQWSPDAWNFTLDHFLVGELFKRFQTLAWCKIFGDPAWNIDVHVLLSWMKCCAFIYSRFFILSSIVSWNFKCKEKILISTIRISMLSDESSSDGQIDTESRFRKISMQTALYIFF